MKNIWKGLTVGAAVGAAIGMAQDGLDGAGRRTARLGHQAAQGAEAVGAGVGEKLRHAAATAHDKFEELSDELAGDLSG